VETQVVESAEISAAFAKYEQSCETQPIFEEFEKNEQNKKVGDFKWQCIDIHDYQHLFSNNVVGMKSKCHASCITFSLL